MCENSAENCKKCELGYALSNGSCLKCHEKCEICLSEDVNTCLICKKGQIGRLQNSGQNCECEDGYFENISTLKCQKCLINNCKICNNLGECLECTSENLLPPNCNTENTGQLTKIVIDENGNQVVHTEKCEFKCEKCENTPSNCTQCI